MSNKQLTGDDANSMIAQIAERIEGHAPGYDVVIYARPFQWKALIAEYERLRADRDQWRKTAFRSMPSMD